MPEDIKYCSFCAKSQREVTLLIAGPKDVFICDECTEVCNSIVYENLRKRRAEIEKFPVEEIQK